MVEQYRPMKELDGSTDRGFVVIHMTENNDIYPSDLFLTYEKALAYVNTSYDEGGVEGDKCIIVAAGVVGGRLVMTTEDHT
jgi:hypothetical protein